MRNYKLYNTILDGYMFLCRKLIFLKFVPDIDT